MGTLCRQLATFAAMLACIVGAFANPNSQDRMSSPKAVFFLSGTQQQLEVAIRSNDASGIARLLEAGASPNAKGKLDVTPLMIAVDAQAPDATVTLLRAGAFPNAMAADGAGVVHLAVANHAAKPHGHAILEMVMRGGGDPNARRPDRDPVLMTFVYDHDLEDLRWFKSLGANLDIQARTSRPLISDVAFGQNWDSAWCMIELGARYDYEGTLYSLSEALDSPYASSPDATLYPAKLKVWEFLRDHGVAVRPWAVLKPADKL